MNNIDNLTEDKLLSLLQHIGYIQVPYKDFYPMVYDLVNSKPELLIVCEYTEQKINSIKECGEEKIKRYPDLLIPDLSSSGIWKGGIGRPGDKDCENDNYMSFELVDSKLKCTIAQYYNGWSARFIIPNEFIVNLKPEILKKVDGIASKGYEKYLECCKKEWKDKFINDLICKV